MTIFDYLSLFSYTLTAIGYIMTNMIWLRIFIMIGCLMDAGIYFFIRPNEPLWVQVAMNFLFAFINAIALIQLIRDKFPPGFYGEIGELYHTIFSQLAPSEFRSLLAIAEWKTVDNAVTLIHAGENNINPMIITKGQVLIEQNNVELSRLEKGAILGEINYLTNIAPQNNVITTQETRLFILSRVELLQLTEKNQAIRASIYSIFGCNIALKLKSMNAEKSAFGVN